MYKIENRVSNSSYKFWHTNITVRTLAFKTISTNSTFSLDAVWKRNRWSNERTCFKKNSQETNSFTGPSIAFRTASRENVQTVRRASVHNRSFDFTIEHNTNRIMDMNMSTSNDGETRLSTRRYLTRISLNVKGRLTLRCRHRDEIRRIQLQRPRNFRRSRLHDNQRSFWSKDQVLGHAGRIQLEWHHTGGESYILGFIPR